MKRKPKVVSHRSIEVTQQRPLFEEELRRLINRHSLEYGCANTPDFILAKYMGDCLQAYVRAVREREKWYGFYMEPGMPDVAIRRSENVAGGK